MGDRIEAAAGRFEISGGLLVRNGVLNIAGQALPLIIGLVSVPTIVHSLGTERFGLLVFTWTLLGAFSVFDLGLGWSVTKFVAGALGRGDSGAVPGILWPAVAGQAVVGTIGAGLLILASPALVVEFLHVPPAMHAEAILAFQIAGLSLPIMLLTVSSRGALEAAQRFDMTAGVKAVSGSSVFLVPLAGVFLGWDLPHILATLLVVRVLLLAVLVLACLRVFPLLKKPAFDRELLKPLFAFGGWMMAAALAGLALGYTDRLVISRALNMTALTHYTLPQELIGRLGLITATLASVLIPAFSTLSGARDLPRLGMLFTRSAKFVVLITGPAFALLAIFAQDVLRLWLGPALAAPSAPVLRVLALGAGLQVLAAIPASLVQALGRPDLTAKFYILEAPLYLAAAWWLVHLSGIEGVAVAWSGRFALDGLLLLLATQRMGLWSWRTSAGSAGRVIGSVVAVCALSALIYATPLASALKTGLIAGLMVAFYWVVWTAVLRGDERQWLLRLTTRSRPSAPGLKGESPR